MVEADQSLSHTQLSDDSRIRLARAIVCIAQLDARNRVKDRIKAEGRKLSQFRAKEISALAEALIAERRDEFIARAKASGAVREELHRLYTKEATALLRKLARKSQVMCKSERPAPQGLPMHECHAQNGAPRGPKGHLRIKDGAAL
jgi:hypothetical protein